MGIGLFEDRAWSAFLPLTRTRPLWGLWWGMDRLMDKWPRYYGWRVEALWPAQPYFSARWPVFETAEAAREFLWVNARLLPWTPELVRIAAALPPQSAFLWEGFPILVRGMPSRPEWEVPALEAHFRLLPWPSEVPPRLLQTVTDLFQLNQAVIEADWRHLTRASESLPTQAMIRGRENLYLAEGARIDWAFIDATEGPVYVGPGAHIQDAAVVGSRNIIGPETVITSGTRLRTKNSIGPTCKLGGEIGQSTFLGFSNKAHEGFMGHSVIGEWCNIGAGSNTSNLKNTYGSVRLHDIASGQLRETNLQFCGLIMGDYARCGIQTAFTTGCVVDVAANVVSTGFTEKYIPPFHWAAEEVWALEGLLETIRRMKARRHLSLTSEEETVLRSLYATLVKKGT